jgi:large subunit ribosomal protein L21
MMADSESARSTEPARPARTKSAPRATNDSNATYAIIETGGKQYRVAVGDRLSVEKLPLESGSDVTFDRVLMVGGSGPARVGTPLVAGATVSGQIEEQYRGQKIVVFKYKPKKRYRRRTGHRQALTRVAITAINA